MSTYYNLLRIVNFNPNQNPHIYTLNLRREWVGDFKKRNVVEWKNSSTWANRLLYWYQKNANQIQSPKYKMRHIFVFPIKNHIFFTKAVDRQLCVLTNLWINNASQYILLFIQNISLFLIAELKFVWLILHNHLASAQHWLFWTRGNGLVTKINQ